jgi:hypothetical protein
LTAWRDVLAKDKEWEEYLKLRLEQWDAEADIGDGTADKRCARILKRGIAKLSKIGSVTNYVSRDKLSTLRPMKPFGRDATKFILSIA